ncbi:MAG: CoA-disulfide reductase [Oscillospiraceae bacterium]|nr:CoA-disulfide reductase [Oscillospiraceae bacterium]
MKMIIIGGVAAGMSAASKAKRVDRSLDITVYEKTAHISLGACGLPYYIGGFFDDAAIMLVKTVEEMEKAGVSVKIRHEVTEVDPATKTVTVRDLETGREFTDSYDKLAITTGARGIDPDIPGVNLSGVYQMRSFEDGTESRKLLAKPEVKDVVIIGSGPIGIEAAHAARHLGKNVTLIIKRDRILRRYFDGEITKIMEDELIRQGVDLRLGELAKEITGDVSVTGLTTDKGHYKADMIIHSIGAAPNTEFLRDTGISMDKGGAILVDEYGETNLEDVYSAGDCATIHNIVKGGHSYSPLATVANKLGRVIGENMAGGKVGFTGSLDSMCIQVMEIEAGRTGITEAEAAALGLDFRTVFAHDVSHSGYYPGQEDIFIKLIYDAKTKVLLGGQAAGRKGAVLRVNTLAACIQGKMTTGQLALLDLCYSPPFSKPWDALNVAGSLAK